MMRQTARIVLLSMCTSTGWVGGRGGVGAGMERMALRESSLEQARPRVRRQGS